MKIQIKRRPIKDWIESGIVYRDGDGYYMMHVWLDADTCVTVSLGTNKAIWAEYAAHVLSQLTEENR